MKISKAFPLLLLIPTILFAAWNPPLKAGEEADLLIAIRKGHALLEKKCLQNIRVEEVALSLEKGQLIPSRFQNYLGSPNAYLLKTWHAGGNPFSTEQYVINRADGRFYIGKGPNGEYVVLDVVVPRPPLEGYDQFFSFAFPINTLWTGRLTDFLSQKDISFKIVKQDKQGVEIDITHLPPFPKSPFFLSPMQIIVDSKTYAIKTIKGRQVMSGNHVAIEAFYKEGFPESITFKGGPNPEDLSIKRVHKFSKYRTEPIANSAFSMLPFGLMEPNPEFQNP